MFTSKKLSNERITEIMDFPITYDKDSPKLTAEQIARMKPIHAKYWKVEPVKIALSIKLDADILAWFKSKGPGYQTRINQALREVMMNTHQT
jgi:uncharacterized protein (DUF4415 family)